MDKRLQLQFRLLTVDAQRSAIGRLALRGLSDEEIAQETGWAVSDIRGVLEPPILPELRSGKVLPILPVNRGASDAGA